MNGAVLAVGRDQLRKAWPRVDFLCVVSVSHWLTDWHSANSSFSAHSSARDKNSSTISWADRTARALEQQAQLAARLVTLCVCVCGHGQVCPNECGVFCSKYFTSFFNLVPMDSLSGVPPLRSHPSVSVWFSLSSYLCVCVCRRCPLCSATSNGRDLIDLLSLICFSQRISSRQCSLVRSCSLVSLCVCVTVSF